MTITQQHLADQAELEKLNKENKIIRQIVYTEEKSKYSGDYIDVWI